MGREAGREWRVEGVEETYKRMFQNSSSVSYLQIFTRSGCQWRRGTTQGPGGNTKGLVCGRPAGPSSRQG